LCAKGNEVRKQLLTIKSSTEEKELVSWSLTSLFSTNMAISETKEEKET